MTPTRIHSLCFAFFLLAATLPARAQDTGIVRGSVENEAGEPVYGLSVVIEGTALGTATGADGAFTIRNVPAGRQVLMISGVGYVTERRDVEVAPGRTTSVDVTIRTAVVPLENVQVVSRRGALEDAFETQYQASKAETTVDAETARDFNSANTYDALRLVPGVSYMYTSGSRHGKPTNIRGGSTWAIPDVIEDFPSLREAGIGAEDGGLTADLGSSIPAVALQSIEVQKGSLGVLYAGDADGGVIVNRLKQGRPGRPRGTVWFELNPIAERLLMADVGGGTGTFDYYAAGKWLGGEYTKMIDPVGRNLQDERFYSGLGKFGYTPRSNMRLELFLLKGRDQIDYTQPRRDDPETPDVDESTALPPNEFETTNTNGFYGLTFDHSISNRVSYELGYSLFDQHALRFSVTEGIAHRDRPETAHTAFGNLYFSHPFSEQVNYQAKAGIEVVSHRQREVALDSDKNQRFQDQSVFYANTLSFGRRLSLNAGARFVHGTDDFDTHNMLVYDAGAAYRIPGIETRLRSAYSTGYSRNKGFAYFFGPIQEAGGVALSENRTLEAGIDQPFALPFLKGQGQLSVTGFRTFNERVPVFSGWGANRVYYEDQRVHGLEVSLDQRFRQALRLFGSFTYMDTEITATTHPEGINVENTGIQVPRYTGALGAEVTVVPKLHLSVLGSYNDGMRSRVIDLQTGEVTITTNTPYTRLNAALDYDVSDRFTATLRVENILDETDLGYSQEVLGPDGYTFTETVADDPGRFVSLAFVVNY